MKETRIAGAGAELHVVSEGDESGPLMVFLHGFPEFWWGWRKQLGYFGGKGYWVVAPDQRGYNLSGKPEAVSEYASAKLVEDVLAILDWAKRDRAIIVGHDWGAAVAWALALRHPERVEKLVILNVPHPKVMLRRLRGDLRQMLRSWYIFAFQLPWLPELALSLAQEAILARGLKSSSRPGTFSDADLEKYRDAWSQPGALRGMVNWYRAALRAPGQGARLERVRVPTLILWGEKDRFLGTELARESLELCDDGKLELFPEASHWVQHEESSRVNDEILAFIR